MADHRTSGRLRPGLGYATGGQEEIVSLRRYSFVTEMLFTVLFCFLWLLLRFLCCSIIPFKYFYTFFVIILLLLLSYRSSNFDLKSYYTCTSRAMHLNLPRGKGLRSSE